ncbi:adenosine deaminase [Mesorhizobium sp. SP-1A]|uniref:adenosine deaminase n=1 Tax=Mesorhizobium sp. SP-1A TaxID=3077840 RepID=UPI0028F70BF6|nr:adenosine deaminase [Mesorhizobium sp. SP-1A]
MNMDQYLRRLPKVDLHFHLAGTLQPRTLFDLARKNGVNLPNWDETKIYDFRDFYDFLEVLECIARCIVSKGDFARVSYEAMRDAARAGNLRYAELFFNPQYHYPQGISYATMVDGYIEGLEAAQKDFGVEGRLIPSINRELGAGAALDMVRDVVGQPRDRVIGLGMDCAEYKGKPHLFVEAYAMARKAGLRCTAHVCEDNQTLEQAPPSHVMDCLDLLGCDRLDHGYNMLADPAVVRRCRDCGIACTVGTHTCIASRMQKRWDSVRKMRDAGLNLTLATDDPPMFGTDIGQSYVTAHEWLGLSAAEAADLALAGVDATWLDDGEKRDLRRSFSDEIAALKAELPAQPADG